MRLAALVTAFVISVPAVATAEDQKAVVVLEKPKQSTRNYINFRLGADSGSKNGKPVMCLEGAPIDLLSIEMCGTGAGFMHHDESPEVAHFRLKLKLKELDFEEWNLALMAGLGFAEFQIGQDEPGFKFTSAGPSGNETAGAEASAHVRTQIPLWEGFEIMADIFFSAAYVPHAPKLQIPLSKFQPGLGVSIGAGF